MLHPSLLKDSSLSLLEGDAEAYALKDKYPPPKDPSPPLLIVTRPVVT